MTGRRFKPSETVDFVVVGSGAAGGVIAFYQVGYGIAAFSVGPLQSAGLNLSQIFTGTAAIAAVLLVLAMFVSARVPRDGARPPVAVWTLRQLVTFLTGVENDRLAALWWLIALRGLRRGEAAALDRDDLDSESRELTITRQLIALPGELYCGAPKSRASIRTIALDQAGTRRLVDQTLRQTVELLRHQFTDQRRSDSRTGNKSLPVSVPCS